MAGNKNQANQAKQENQVNQENQAVEANQAQAPRLDEHSDDLQGDLSAEESAKIAEWYEAKRKEYEEELERKIAEDEENAKKKKEVLNSPLEERKKRVDTAKQHLEDAQKAKKQELDALNAEYESLNAQEEQKTEQIYAKKAPEIISEYDAKIRQTEKKRKSDIEFKEQLSAGIEVLRSLDEIQKERAKVKYVEQGEKNKETIDSQAKKVNKSAMSLKFNEEEQKENKGEYQAKMTELSKQLKNIEKEQNKLSTRLFNAFTGKKDKLAKDLENKSREIRWEMEEYQKKQTIMLSAESRLKSEFKESQANLTDEMEKFRKDEERNNELLAEENKKKAELEAFASKLSDKKNQQLMRSLTANEMLKWIPKLDDSIQKGAEKVDKLKKDKEKALSDERKAIKESFVKENQEKHDELDKKKKVLERPLEEKRITLKAAENAYQQEIDNIRKKTKEIDLSLMSNRNTYKTDHDKKLRQLDTTKKEAEERFQKYSLLSRAVEELSSSHKKVVSNSAAFNTMVEALKTCSDMMKQPGAKKSELNESCISAIRACEEYVAKRNHDIFKGMRSDYGKYRIDRANSIVSALQKFSPEVAEYINRQKEQEGTRVRVSLNDDKKPRKVTGAAQKESKTVEKGAVQNAPVRK